MSVNSYLNMDVGHLIEEIKIRPPLWDQSNKYFNLIETKQRLWSEVAEIVNIPVEDAKKKWKVLKDLFRRQMKKVCSGLKKEPVWAYYNSLMFLHAQANGNKKDISNPDNSCDGRFAPESVIGDCEQESTMMITSSPTIYSGDESLEDKDDYFQPSEEPTSTAMLNVVAHYGGDTEADTVASADQTSIKRSREQLELEDFLEIGKVVSKCRQHYQRETTLANEESQREQHNSHLSNIHRHLINTTDDDYNFLLSFLPSIKSMPLQKKMLFRLKMQQLLYTTLFDEDSTNGTTPGVFSSKSSVQ